MNSEQEQNKKINQHSRQISDLQQRVKTLELDVDAGGRISEAFEEMDAHIDRVEKNLTKRMDRLERNQNEIKGALNVILEHLTGVNDLPEE